MESIGFIGVGVMGKSMVRNLMKNGYAVSIYTRTKSKVEDLIAEGALWQSSVAQCTSAKHAVITMVGYPKDVQEVYFGAGGILQSADRGCYLIDMTTTDPALSVQIAGEAAGRGLHALDAPVSGGDSGAAAGTLSIMVGGEESAFEICLPLFKAMGQNIRYTGCAGSGQHTKMANQIALAGVIAGVCEAMAYAQKSGLDVQNMLDCISKGAAGSWQMSNTAPRILQGDFDPGFYMKHYIKDLNIALDRAEDVSLPLEITGMVCDLYMQLQAEEKGDLGTQALIQHYGWQP